MSWLVVQVCETVFPVYGLDEALIRPVIVVLLSGFLPALAVSWAFEWAPGGPRRQSDIDREAGTLQSSGRGIDRAIIVVLAVALLFFAADKFLGSAGPVENERSIAVLPFDDMTATQDQTYFADGIAEELLNLLAKNPSLQVAARTSSFSFRNASLTVDEIGRRLGVRHIVEGSVRRDGDRIRVTAQLISADDGYHLWSETYDAAFADIFSIQAGISEQIAAALESTMLGNAPLPQTTDPDAYSLYLRAVYQARQATRESYARAAELFLQTLAMDPDYQPALSNLAAVRNNQAAHGYIDYDQGYEEARELALRAIEVAPGEAGGYYQLAWIAQWYEADLAAAVRNMETALRLSPNSPPVIGNAAVLLLHIGRLQESIRLAEISARRSPVEPAAFFNLGLAYMYADRLDDAERSFRKALALSPGYNDANYQLGLTYLLRGRPDEALDVWQEETGDFHDWQGRTLAYFALGRKEASDAALEKLIEGWGDEWPSVVVQAYAYRSETDKAFEWLEKEYEKFGAAG